MLSENEVKALMSLVNRVANAERDISYHSSIRVASLDEENHAAWVALNGWCDTQKKLYNEWRNDTW